MCVLQLCLSNLRSLETQTLAMSEAVKPSAERTKICLAQLSQNPQRMCWVMLAQLPGVHSLGASGQTQSCGLKDWDGPEGVKLHWNSKSLMPAMVGSQGCFGDEVPFPPGGWCFLLRC